jgi:hypothetical protein
MNSEIEKYIGLLLSQYELDKDALIKLWMDNTVEIPKVDDSLLGLKRTELQAMCKSKGLPYSGTKQVLLDQLSSGKNVTKNSAKKPSIKKGYIYGEIYSTSMSIWKPVSFSMRALSLSLESSRTTAPYPV